MAYAFFELTMALKAVTGTDNKRAGLTRAINKISSLRMKDLPAEAREDFTFVTSRVFAHQRYRPAPEDVRKYVSSLTDTEVNTAILKLKAIYNAFAYYQPLPQPHPGMASPPALHRIDISDGRHMHY